MDRPDLSSREWSQLLVQARRQHAAWVLLAARRAPLILACMQRLLKSSVGGVDQEDAVQSLASMLGEYANDPEFDIGTAGATARRWWWWRARCCAATPAGSP